MADYSKTMTVAFTAANNNSELAQAVCVSSRGDRTRLELFYDAIYEMQTHEISLWQRIKSLMG